MSACQDADKKIAALEAGTGKDVGSDIGRSDRQRREFLQSKHRHVSQPSHAANQPQDFGPLASRHRQLDTCSLPPCTLLVLTQFAPPAYSTYFSERRHEGMDHHPCHEHKPKP